MFYCIFWDYRVAVQSIPNNWKRAVFCDDSTSPIEPVPGLTTYPLPFPWPHHPLVTQGTRMSLSSLLAFLSAAFSAKIDDAIYIHPGEASSELMAGIHGPYTPHQRIAMWLASYVDLICVCFMLWINGLIVATHYALAAISIAIHLVPIWFRWSLKATAIVWLPVLYIAADIAPSSWSAQERLDNIIGAETAKLSRRIAAIVLIGYFIKFFTRVVWYKQLATIFVENEWLRTLIPVVRPIDVPSWQVLSSINALGAWGVLLWADWESRMRRRKQGRSDNAVLYTLVVVVSIRWLITLFTSGCTLVELGKIVLRSHPPKINWVWLPSFDSPKKHDLIWTWKNQYDKAIEACTEAIRFERDKLKLSVWFNRRGIVWQQKGEYDKAVSDFTEAIHADSSSVDAYVNRGTVWAEKMEYDRALRDFQVAIELDVDSSLACRGRGDVWYDKADFARAIEDYETCIQLSGDLDAFANMQLGWIYAACPNESFRDAGKALEHANRGNDLMAWKDGQLLSVLAAAYAEAGDRGAAIRWQKEAIKHTNGTQKSVFELYLSLYEAGSRVIRKRARIDFEE